MLEVNLVGPFRLTKAIAGGMALRGRGLVVNVTSDASISAYASWGAYSVSKAALDHLARVWAAELAESGVRFLTVDPGEMDTAMHAEAMPEADRATLADPAAVADRIVDIVRHAERIAERRAPRGRIVARLSCAGARRREPRVGAHAARPPPAASRSAVGRAARLPRARSAAARPRRATSWWSTTRPRCRRRSPGAPPTERSWRCGWRARTRTRRGRRSCWDAGDWRQRTEDRPAPPALAVGTQIAFGPGLAAPRDRRVDLSPAARHAGLRLHGLDALVGALPARAARAVLVPSRGSRAVGRAAVLRQPAVGLRAGVGGPRLERQGDGRPARRRGHRRRA